MSKKFDLEKAVKGPRDLVKTFAAFKSAMDNLSPEVRREIDENMRKSLSGLAGA